MLTWIRSHRWETATIALAVALIVALVTLVVVAGGEDQEPVAVGETTTTTVAVTTTQSDSSATSTLSSDSTVTTVPGPSIEGLMATAVVVDNVPNVGFQIGIDWAEILIEVPVEGDMTRYTAIFDEDTPELVGPVRSLRPVSADLLALFTPRVFTTGGQPFVTGMVEGTGAVLMTPDTSVAYQTLERPRPHHLFVTPSLEGDLDEIVIEPWEWGEWVGGDPATEVSIPIGRGVTWRFENGSYVRYEDGAMVEVQSTFDGDPVPLVRDTVVVLMVNQKSAGYNDSAGFEVPTFDVVGSGEAMIYHQGEAIAATWSRASQAEGYVFTDPAGSAVGVPNGSVFLALVPTGDGAN